MRNRLVLLLVVSGLLTGCLGAASPSSTTEEGPGRRSSRGGAGLVVEPGSGQADFGDADKLWDGRTEIRVMDKEVPWHDNTVGPTLLTSSTRRAGQPIVHSCLWSPAANRPQEPYFTNQWVFFDDPRQLVINGTTEIRLRLSWSQLDYPFDELSYAYRPRDANWTQGPMVKNGKDHSFAVQAGTWDFLGSSTQWEFVACLVDKAGPQTWGRAFVGSFHIEMTLVRGAASSPTS